MNLLEPADPIVRFLEALEHAKASERHDATAMTLATADARGRPSARVVLLKGVDARGFSFYTNRASRKGDDLGQNPFAALCFYWPASGQQVRIEGHVELCADAESDAYFASRPHDSQIGAWASKQSRPLASREVLEAEVRTIEARYPAEVPRPPHWGGYRVLPERIEFWFDRPSRLHDRVVYTRARQDAPWSVVRLYP